MSTDARRAGRLLSAAALLGCACGQPPGGEGSPSGGAGPGGSTSGVGGDPSGTGGGASGGGSGGTEGGPVSGGGSPVGGGVGGGTGDASGGRAAGGTSATGGMSSAGASSGGAGTGGGPMEACSARATSGHYQMERLSRGLVAVRSGAGTYVGWRMLGHEYDAESPARISYRLYRDGVLLHDVTDSTNYYDAGAPAGAGYAVSVVMDGAECARSEEVTAWASPFIEIPLSPPPGGTTPDGVDYAYDVGRVTRSTGAVNDGSPGDVDGDGDYELIVIWEPSNAQDNANDGFTGPVYMDCYELSGERLWRLNLGQNIRAGAHYTQFVVYDFDGDGRAEVAVKTAPGTQDSSGSYLKTGPAANDEDTADYRNSTGRVLSGPEYLTVFDGKTGVELSTVDFQIGRGSVAAWGDDYGNRVDRFLASAAFVSDLGSSGQGSGRPALLMARGYYTRATVSAWTWRDGQLTRIWTADSAQNPGSSDLAGQGAHSMVVADVDADFAQEIVYGAAMIQSDGSFGCSTQLNHGDALHVGDLVPTRPGLEVFMPHEDKAKPWWHLRDAATCEVLQQSTSSGADNGRGVAADILASSPGAEMWSASDASLRSCQTGQAVNGAKPALMNFLIWWDADELRELEDGTSIVKGDGQQLLTCDNCTSNNYTKSTPTLAADLFGDWREEIIWRSPTSDALRVYTTTDVTQRRIYTLMHDAQYRMQVSSEMTGYNQPPHPGFFLGDGMPNPPEPDMHVK